MIFSMGRFGFAILLAVPLAGLVSCTHSALEYVRRGDRFFAEAKYGDAEINYRKAIQKNSKLGEGYFGLGKTLLKEGKGAGYQALVMADSLLPENLDVQATLADLALSAYLADSRRPKYFHDLLNRLSQRLLSEDQGSFTALRVKGALALDERRPKEAIEAFVEARKSKPTHPDAVLGLSQAFFLDGQFQQGERLATDLVGRDKTFLPIYDVLYVQYVANNRIQDAERILQLKAENNPKQIDPVLRLARYYAQAKEPGKMNAALQRLLNHPDDFPQAQQQVGDFYAAIGMGGDAIRQFEAGAKAHPQQALIYQKSIAKVLAAQGKRDDALRILDEVLTVDRGDPEIRALRAKLWLESGTPEKLDRTIEELRTLVQDKGDDLGLRWDLGRALFRKRQLEAAAREFSEAIRVRGDFLPAHFALAEIAMVQKKHETVLNQAKEILTLDAGNPRARLLEAAGKTGMGMHQAAHQELRQLQKEFPHDTEVQIQLGILAIAEKKYAEAEAIFRGIGRNQLSDARPSMGLAEVYLLQDQSKRALEVLKEEVTRTPSSQGLRSVLATAAVQLGDYDLAMEQYRYLLSVTPKSLDAELGLGEVYRLKGDLNSSIATLKEAISENPKSPAPVILLAYTYETSGQVDDAKQYYRRALHLNPDPAVMNNLAYLMAESGDNLDEALNLVRLAMQKVQNQPTISDTLGLIYLKKGIKDSALRIFTNLVKQNPEDATFRYHLGLTLLATGDRQRALSELTEALERRPDGDVQQKIKKALTQIR
jgi:tetratricopeptide (TPR) repeat protein